MNQAGSSMLETIITAPIVGLVGIVIAASLYLGYSRLVVTHFGYRSLICVASRQPKTLCRKHFHKKLNRFLPLGKLGRFVLRGNRRSFSVDLKWNLWIHQQIHYKKRLKYAGGY